MSADPAIDDAGRTEIDEDALIRGLLEQEVVPAQPDESECRRYYDPNIDRFRTPELFEAAHILIKPEGSGEQAWAVALERAQATIVDVAFPEGALPASSPEEAYATLYCPGGTSDERGRWLRGAGEGAITNLELSAPDTLSITIQLSSSDPPGTPPSTPFPQPPPVQPNPPVLKPQSENADRTIAPRISPQPC